MFNDPDSDFGKGYLKLLVDEIRIENNQAVMKGNYEALAQTVSVLNPKTSASSVPFLVRNGAPGEIRTPDPLVRSQVLYPAELRARCLKLQIFCLTTICCALVAFGVLGSGFLLCSTSCIHAIVALVRPAHRPTELRARCLKRRVL